MDATPAPRPDTLPGTPGAAVDTAVDDGTAPRRPRVAVVFGGRSGEHGISCVTASGVLRAIDRDRYDVVPIGITRAGRWVLGADDPTRWSITDGRLPEVTDDDAGAAVVVPLATDDSELLGLPADGAARSLGHVDVVLPLLHGPYGEDGTIQGMLDLAGIRYVGAGVLASAVGMDKHYMKVVLEGHGIPVAPYVVVRPGRFAADPAGVTAEVERLGLPVFVKPARAGSSLGITRVADLADLPDALRVAAEHDPKVLVEAGVVGREIECAVLGGRDGAGPRTSVPGEIVVVDPQHAFYDFEAKYLDEAGVVLRCPADLPAAVEARVRELAAATFEAIGCEGLARVDTFVTEGGEVLVNEINTMPGFTPFSMYPRMWEASGLAYADLIDELLQLALTRTTGLR
ncbi:D-alanine--D-alanine ligase [Actinotalea ferrariae CF5-4]|uniref:D-alanine--D-alanine ligase n=1 Tax=Actinotalea ferrariae CF5-4 TaxID=948458 RepID=A0A021VLJ0_9CELL|nr:D-alanine--D-alanine ligase family protein [Actinotalea ferrariae]EYR61953.1 D-alanine--D-alanine ligase [Actinotalea ferrariae CF5-4]